MQKRNFKHAQKTHPHIQTTIQKQNFNHKRTHSHNWTDKKLIIFSMKKQLATKFLPKKCECFRIPAQNVGVNVGSSGKKLKHCFVPKEYLIRCNYYYRIKRIFMIYFVRSCSGGIWTMNMQINKIQYFHS